MTRDQLDKPAIACRLDQLLADQNAETERRWQRPKRWRPMNLTWLRQRREAWKARRHG
jgi:hypothetical protein